MSFGMGLGSFVDGFARGYGIRTDIEDRKEAKADRADDRAFRNEKREWMREDREYQSSERQRELDQRAAIENISAETRAEFDEQVAAGEFKPEDYDEFWKQYALPRMQNELLMQGDIDGAKKLMEWGESEDALKGGRLFASAMFKAQTGDHAGALDDVIEAGKLRGYIAGDFDIDEKEPITDADGSLLGYRITIRDSDGNETVQDIAVEDIPTVISTFANPQAAWESQQATAASDDKRADELEDYEARKDIDARYDGNADREAAIESLRDRMEADVMVEDSVNFDDLPRAEREKLIADEIAFMNGTGAEPTAPAPRMIVDTSSGKPVPMPDPAAVESAPGLGGVPAPSPGPGAAMAAPAPTPSAPPRTTNAIVNGAEDASLAVPSHAQLVDTAAQQMVEGKSPQEIARTLTAVGVDRSQWPAELVRVLGTNGPR